MPVYLCKPGRVTAEPWRHGIPVYSEPFAINSSSETQSTVLGLDGQPQQQQRRHQGGDLMISDQPQDEMRNNYNTYPNSEASSVTGGVGATVHHSPDSKAIRRIRHSEVVLVEDVVMEFGNYWLKLIWPGTNRGFAGYVCLMSNTNVNQGLDPTDDERGDVKKVTLADDPAINEPISDEPPTQRPPENLRATYDAPVSISVVDTSESRAPIPGFYEANSNEQTMRCLRTGLVFPSSPALQLLTEYEDGLVPPVALPLEGQQPVFCRICRDGLHDDDDQQEATEGDNPLLAPCECSGSMAFVHYLCVEQWRCRSRHPEARNGTHCETCSKPYALPPPTSRPVSQVEEEWLEAMPPHVMAALRQPHLGWQMGAALVRRRWLRPIAPIILSPLVALYCRARRLLKKRGVSRRRWACSLCRRRARWKCVRCLRSYYCSRQCQNVSWHIVHKHVCYKPSRFWWSVVVYGALLLFMIPGILKDPILYDLALSFIPPSFYIMAVLGGGLATVTKRAGGIDLRGRALELIVVVLTAWLVVISWGLTWGFFGQPQACVGVFPLQSAGGAWIDGVNRFVLKPARTYFLFWDKSAMRYERIKTWLCTSQDDACFPHLSKAAPEAMMESAQCVGDLQLVTFLWVAAGLTLMASALWKKRRRLAARPHED